MLTAMREPLWVRLCCCVGEHRDADHSEEYFLVRALLCVGLVRVCVCVFFTFLPSLT